MKGLSRHEAASLALIVCAALCLRWPITSVASALGPLSDELGLTAGARTAIAGLPVVGLALGALAAGATARLMPPVALAGSGLLLLALVTAVRPASATLMIIGSVAAGWLISAVSVAATQLIRDVSGARSGTWSGMISAAFGVSAALGAWATAPVAEASSARTALGAWSVPTLAAAIALVLLYPRREAGGLLPARIPGGPATAGLHHVMRSPSAWCLVVFFGAQAAVFFGLTSWLPSALDRRGLDPADAAGMLALFSWAGIPVALIGAALLDRLGSRGGAWMPVGASAASVLGLLMIAAGPVAAIGVAVAVVGISQSAVFAIAVAYTVKKSTRTSVSAVAALTMGAGYAVGSLGPFVVGSTFGFGAPGATALLTLLPLVAVQAVFGWRAASAPVVVVAERSTTIRR